MSRVAHSIARFGLPIVLFTAFLPMVHAQLLVNPSGGTVLYDSTAVHDDDVSTGRSLGFTLNYFGTAYTTVDVSTNGNLNFVGDAGFSNLALPSPIARIDPYWDDLYLASGSPSSISEKTGTNYYAVTWNNIGDVNPFHQTGDTFQAVLFGGSVTLGGFQFQAGDIAFSYQSLFTSADNYVTVGLNAGDSSHYAAAPSTTNGIITDPSMLPVDNGKFLLFRANGNNGYMPSVAAAPEPSAFAVLAIGVLGLGALTLRRRFAYAS